MAAEYLTESSQAYAENFVAEDEVIAAARARGANSAAPRSARPAAPRCG